ncbi:SPOR domain-containing protein [Bacillus benzoevorans]|uniref:Stage II sporulation protein B n=1 Tax=Bacillus benzoevorans TaxID=1456 RepID=A0A7X0LVD3_9BACI|nr:SPOR domain-containing protein [Bacillus benzoevorans]MBB6445871.1 stage II sporulation protein B [Bacillus benzoevorans]
MDKPQKGRTITIKIDGNERPKKKNKPEPVPELVLEPVLEPVQEPVLEPAKEQVSTQSPAANHIELESAAAKEAAVEEEPFEWILPTEAEEGKLEQKVEEGSKKKEQRPEKLPFMHNKGKKLNPEKRKWVTTIFLIILCAVILGTIFGLTMLKMVLPDEGAARRSEPVLQQEQPKPPAAAVGSGEIELPPITASVVQAGIYSVKETAYEEQSKLRNKGIPAQVMDMENLGMSGKFALFIGVSNSIAEAKTLSQELGARGIETFAKEITIGEKTVKGIGGEESKLLEIAPQIFQTMTVNLSDGRADAKISPENKAAFAKQEKSLAAIKKDNLKTEKIVQLYAEATAAASQFMKYEDKLDSGTETAVQQHLLAFLALYQEL